MRLSVSERPNLLLADEQTDKTTSLAEFDLRTQGMVAEPVQNEAKQLYAQPTAAA